MKISYMQRASRFFVEDIIYIYLPFEYVEINSWFSCLCPEKSKCELNRYFACEMCKQVMKLGCPEYGGNKPFGIRCIWIG